MTIVIRWPRGVDRLAASVEAISSIAIRNEAELIVKLESTLNAELPIERSTVEFRTQEEPLDMEGYARRPDLQNYWSQQYDLAEVLACSPAGSFSPAAAHWSHEFGNAQQSGAARSQCQEGIDPEATGPLDAVEACGLGPELVLLLPPLYWLSRRRQSRRIR